MSAKIYIHPRPNEAIVAVCARFKALGYSLINTRRGYIEARPIPVLHNVVVLKRRKQ